MKCPYCGYDNPDSSHFCSGCGKNLDEMRAGQGSFRQENGDNGRNVGGDTRRIWDGEKDYREAARETARQEQTRRAQGTAQERRDEYGDYALSLIHILTMALSTAWMKILTGGLTRRMACWLTF